ncbi:hypothetical protein PT974_08714 [Cladobotryum mycophilum]|uniref:F-box domain-containing protein n=1 Tax=Cladobotryum mycophilum TaxID=491253 RepID=A0ABR0SE94_9HYPO
MDASAPDGARRSSIEKTPIVIEGEQPFDRLPDEIIEQILEATDPNGFASLILLNRKWRDVSQRPHLYRRHLAPCPSYVANPSSLPAAEEKNLPRLRRLFAREVKRNLFESYIRPNETLVKLVSNSISSSSCPGGEGLSFAASLRGHHILAYNSSRIYVIDVRNSGLEVKRELKILRRPASACITDDASLLAVLSTEMQVDLYDLKHPRTIALSSCGSVLAAAYEGGIEVSSLNANALPTERRAVKCDAVDALTFSFDGTQILGTTLHSSPPSTVVITAPYYDPGALMLDENLSAMWTTSILFPNSSRDCSHAVLLQDGSQEEAAWAFAYDRSFETFRAVRIDDLRNGTTYFTGPAPKSQAQLLPSTLPSATYNGELVSAGFQGNEIWVYGVPEDPATVPEKESSTDGASGLARRNSSQSGSRPTSTRAHDAAAAASVTGRAPQWQMLCDKVRNHFIAGQKVSELSGVTSVKWVSGFSDSSLKERLVITARGITAQKLVTEEEDFDFVDGGRVVLLDFDCGLTNGTKTELTIEVGTDEAEVLEEERRDMETEVAIVRRRTQKRGVAGSGSGGSRALLRAATTTAQTLAVPQSSQNDDDDDDPLVPRTVGRHSVSAQSRTEAPEEADALSIEEQEALDAPYAHSSPRSGNTLRRAATAAAVNRRLNPRTADGRPIEYRRADGRREHPHESDADNWVPPPPPYQAEDPGDMPAFLRGPAILAPISVPGMPMPPPVSIVQYPASPMSMNPPNHVFPPGPAMMPMQHAQHNAPPHQQYIPSHTRTVSGSSTVSNLRADEITAPRSEPTTPADTINLYDVSPPASPRATNRQFNETPSPQAQRVVPDMSINSSVPSPELARSTITSSRPSSYAETTNSMLATSVQMGTMDFSTAPRIELQSASTFPLNPGPSSNDVPSARRLSNAQTWPLAPPRLEELDASSSRITLPMDPALAALPPAPSSDQLARLNKRISQGNPRRLSGSLLTHSMYSQQQNPTGRSEMPQPSPISVASSTSIPQAIAPQAGSVRQEATPPPTQQTPTPRHEIEQPLIISTPTGVSGAYDPPGRRISRRGDTPILAPVPRRPRPGTAGTGTRPTVERLETIFSVRTQESKPAPPPEPVKKNNRLFASWMRGPSVSPGRSASVVNRRPSRAERSAAKNMQDARKRGWQQRRKSQKRRKNIKKKADAEAATTNTTGWTDVSMPSVSKENGKDKDKDKKCVIM